MTPAIQVERVSKSYDALTALDDVSLDIAQGEFFGLLGPNGAGKTTLINILAGLVLATRGTARVMGFDVVGRYREARRALGVVPQELVFDPFFTVGAGVLAATVWFVDLPIEQPLWIVAFALAGSGVMGTLGIIAGLYSDKADELAAFQNFVILPFTFLSGVFYSIHSLPPFWQKLSLFNPFFYMVDGFRYGFLGRADVSPWLSLAFVAAGFLALSFLTLRLIRIGYKLRH